jgi:hypothetical protein
MKMPKGGTLNAQPPKTASGKPLVPETGAFKGANPQLEGYTYTHTPDYQTVDQYERTTERIIDFVCSSCKQAHLVKQSLKLRKKVEEAEPALGKSEQDDNGKAIPSEQDKLKYNIQFKSWETRKEELKTALSNAYNIILGQCNQAMKSKLKEQANWATVDAECDAVALLVMLQAIAHNAETQKNPILSLQLAEKNLMNAYQKDHLSLDGWLLKFEARCSVVTSMGGQLYRASTLALVCEELKLGDFNKLDEAKQKEIIATAEERWKSVLFINNSNNTRFDQLKKQLQNEFLRGGDDDEKKYKYPKTMVEAYQLLNQYQPYASAAPAKTVEKVDVAFHQRETKQPATTGNDSGKPKAIIKAPRRFKRFRCPICGKRGHVADERYCQMTRDIADQRRADNKNNGIMSDSSHDDSSDSSSSNSRPKKSRKSKKKKKADQEKAVKKMVKEVVMTIFSGKADSTPPDTESDEGSVHSGDGFFQFAGCHVEAPSTNSRSGGTHKSGKNSRSGETNSWKPVARKNKRKGKKKSNKKEPISDRDLQKAFQKFVESNRYGPLTSSDSDSDSCDSDSD